MTPDQMQTLITTVGFPIFVCMWFMVRTEKVINTNTQALNNNSMVLNKFTEKF